MKKMAAMTAIVALVCLPVLAAEQGGFSGPGATQTSQTSYQKGGFIGPSVVRSDDRKSRSGFFMLELNQFGIEYV